MRTILLTRGFKAIVDDEDYGWLSASRWHAHSSKTSGPYAKRGHNGERMHRLIMGKQYGESAVKNMEVDHINQNTLDNRRGNLRICTHGQNQQNSRKYTCNKSGFRGVVWHKRIKKWQAQIRSNGKNHHLGYFKTPKEAALVYDLACKRMHKKFANPNFLLKT